MKKPALAIFPILLGFGLRVYNLTYHSLWFDEAISLRWAKSTVPTILDVSMHLVEDRLPPLYYLLLKGWGLLAGFSEFSVRYLSVALGVLLVAVIYSLGRRLFNSAPASLAAALLAALNPFLVWYSQEARMYALAVLVGSLGVLCFLKAMESGRLGWWLGFGLAALAGLYTHLYTGFLWPALAIWLVLNPKILRRVWLKFGLVMGAVSLLFAPLALANWRFSGESQPGNPLAGGWERTVGLFKAFIIWRAQLSAPVELGITLVLAAFLLAGIALALAHSRGRLTILLLVTPFVIAGLLMLKSNLAFFGQRYFIVMVPWLLLLQGVVIGALLKRSDRRRQLIGWGSVLLLAGASFWPLPGQWTVPAAKEAWRQTVAYMTTHVNPADGIFIHPEWIRFPYQYYAAQMKTPGQTYAYFFSVNENTDLDGPLNGILEDHPVIWLIESHLDEPDPDRRVENWFAARYPLVTELYPPGVVLKAYAPGYQLDQLPAEATLIKDGTFSAGLILRGYQLFDAKLPPAESLFHPPSNWVHVTLYWSAVAGTPDVFPQVNLVDGQGQVWGASLARENDAFHFYPPSRWQTGQIIRLDVDVNLNPAAPPGQYRLEAVVNGESVAIAPVELTR